MGKNYFYNGSLAVSSPNLVHIRMPSHAKKNVSMGALDGLIGFHLRIAQIRVFKDFEDGVGELGLTPAGFSVMEVLRQNPGLTQSKLAAAIMLDRSSVVPLLDKLEKKGLLSRQSSTTDRRNNHLFLSEEGLKVLEASKALVKKHESRIAKALSKEESQQLIGLLSRLAV